MTIYGRSDELVSRCIECDLAEPDSLTSLGGSAPGVADGILSGESQSVLANTTIPDSTLKKKSQSIAYYFIREGAARDEWRTTYINTHENEADLLTKQLPSGEKGRALYKNYCTTSFERKGVEAI